MSYRAFKRLLGETSLERKCRFLFGGFTLLLITASFWLYLRQTEHLAYDQITTTCRLLVNPIVAQQHPSDDERRRQALDDFRLQWEAHWPEGLREYRYQFIKPNASPRENKVDDSYGLARLQEF